MIPATRAALLLFPLLWCLPAIAEEWRAELSDGSAVEGGLRHLSRQAAELSSGGTDRTIPVESLRKLSRITSNHQEPRAGDAAFRRVRATLVDGSWIEGDDIIVSRDETAIVRDSSRVRLPPGGIESIECRPRKDSGEPPKWLASAAESVDDVVVVGGDDEPDFVECAIESVSADAVTVVLDEEKIPVKRSKVIGLKWHRPKPAAERTAAVAIDLDGGGMRAASVEIADGSASLALPGLGILTVPADWLNLIDYAGGRRISLVAVEPERADVEPWFGIFASIDVLSNHFKPRRTTLTSADGRVSEAIRIRPRTLLAWRLPIDAKTMSMTVSNGGDPASSASPAAGVVVTVDDREIYRGTPLEPATLEADVAGGRRLTIRVDFPRPPSNPEGMPGGEVLLIDPVVER